MKKRVLITMTVYILAALCFFAYGMMIFNTGSGTKFYLVWYALGVVMLIAAAAVRLQIWQGLPVFLRKLLISGVLLGAITVISTWALIFTEFNSKGKPDLDYIIVLGAQVRASGPSVILKYRLDTTVDYLNANPNTKCIVSGGKGYNEPEPEGVVMKKYLMENGIDKRRIIVEDKSADTSQNIKNSIALIDAKNSRVGIVTNNFHVFRGVHLAVKAGFKEVYGVAAPANIYYLPNNMLRETIGILKDFIMGNLA